MIDFKISEKENRFTIDGEVADLTREVLTLVGVVYAAIHDESELAAEFYRDQIGIYATRDGFWDIAVQKHEGKVQ
jgi:hypothetical protein